MIKGVCPNCEDITELDSDLVCTQCHEEVENSRDLVSVDIEGLRIMAKIVDSAERFIEQHKGVGDE